MKNRAIPVFPHFKKLTLEDKKHLDQILETLPPYSDFIFSSLWCWNTNPPIEISALNKNLIFKMPDYVTNKSFITFLGSNSIEETINALLEYSQSLGLETVLRILPEHNFNNYDLTKLHPKYHLAEDRDNFDYVLSIDKLASMSGLYRKKNKVNLFKKTYKYKITIENLNQKRVQRKVLEFVKDWFENHKNPRAINNNEIIAINKLLKYSKELNPKVLCLYVEGALVGFSIFELFNKEYAIHAFQKANREYKGVYEFLYYNLANYLKKQKFQYLNIEQDLGIEGLRQAKLGYNPHFFLKKYIISHKKSSH